MLSRSRCPHTGVVNYFMDADPLLSVGSVAEAHEPKGFAWRCYVGKEAGGFAPDLPRAEAHLTRAIARAVRSADARHQACATTHSRTRAASWSEAGR